MPDLICAGLALVDSIIRGFDPRPVSSSGYRAVSGTLSVGGEAVNEAMAAARLGVKTAILCALGPDAAGDLVKSALEKSGVDTTRIIREGVTPVSTLFVREDAGRVSVTNEAHRQNFHPEKRPELFTDAKALMLGSLFRAPFDDPEIICSVVKSAKRAGQIVFADTKLPNFRPLGLEDIREALALTDYITPNEAEARYYSGKDVPEEMADAFLDYGVKNVIIKLGAEGCLLKNPGGSVRLKAYRVNAVDSTGAGDNFLAGFASAILRNETAAEALAFANACGAICTTAVGAGTALRDREQVLELMRQQGVPGDVKVSG